MNNQTKPTRKTKTFSYCLLILLTSFSLSISSCKKTGSGNGFTPAKYVYKDDVYVGGRISNYPAYWKNGQLVQLSKTNQGEVYAITASGTNVYAVGKSGIPGSFKVVVWKNGKVIQLTDGIKESHPNGIAVSGSTVHVVGYEEGNNIDVAKYWTINADDKVIGTPLSNGTSANAIAVSNDHVYITGEGHINSKDIVAIWKDGVYITGFEGTGSYGPSGYGIAVANNKVYVGGEEGNAKYWVYDATNTISTSLGANSAMYYSLNCIALNATNNVYVAWSDYSGVYNKAMYSKDGKPVILSSSSATTDERAQSIAVAGNNVYVTGYSKTGTDKNTLIKSLLWINGAKVPGFDGTQQWGMEFTALFVVKK